MPSKGDPPSKEIPSEWWCNAVVPGVDACIQAIQKKGVVGKYPSLFYTSWSNIGLGKIGYQGAGAWAKKNICGRFVDFGAATTSGYQISVETALLRPFGPAGLDLEDEDLEKIRDPFLKNLSQAFAEQSTGDAYVVVPQGVDFHPDSAWTGWEYPALTRNVNINIIWKVELDYSDQSLFVTVGAGPPGVKTLLWQKGDPPSAIEPKGMRRGSLPPQISEDQVPPNWQSSI